MKSTYQIRGQMFSDFFGYSKKRKVSSGVKENQVKESEHVLSRVTGTVCNNMMDDQMFLTDPATLGGRIELGDRVALASSPKKLLGELIGITGFRRAVVMLEAGGTNEYGAEDLVMLEKKDVFKDNVPGVAFEPVEKNESRKSSRRHVIESRDEGFDDLPSVEDFVANFQGDEGDNPEEAGKLYEEILEVVGDIRSIARISKYEYDGKLEFVFNVKLPMPRKEYPSEFADYMQDVVMPNEVKQFQKGVRETLGNDVVAQFEGRSMGHFHIQPYITVDTSTIYTLTDELKTMKGVLEVANTIKSWRADYQNFLQSEYEAWSDGRDQNEAVQENEKGEHPSWWTSQHDQAYTALQAAAERLGRGFGPSYQKQIKRNRKGVVTRGASLDPRHAEVIQALNDLGRNKITPEEAMALIGSYEIFQARMNSPREEAVDDVKKRYTKGYRFKIEFDKNDKLEPVYTKTQQQASELMRDQYKDKKNYKISPIGQTESLKDTFSGALNKSIGEEEDLDDTAVQELVISSDSDSDLYKKSFVPIVKNLMRKIRNGTYDHELSKKQWMYHAEAAAKRYCKEFCGEGDKWFEVFPKNVCKAAAAQWADAFKVEADLGNYDNPTFK